MSDDPGQYVLACELPHEPEQDDHEQLSYAQWGTGPDRFGFEAGRRMTRKDARDERQRT